MKKIKYILILSCLYFGVSTDLVAQNLTDKTAKMSNSVPSEPKVAPPIEPVKAPKKGKQVSEKEKNAMIQKFYQSRVDFLRTELNKDVSIVEEAKSKVNGFSQQFANQLSDQIITQEVYDKKMTLLAELREQIKTYDAKILESQQYLTPVK